MGRGSRTSRRLLTASAGLALILASCTNAAPVKTPSSHPSTSGLGATSGRRSSSGVSILAPTGWVFQGYQEPTDESNPKVPFALGTWPFQQQVIFRGPIPHGRVMIDLEEWAPPYAPGFPVPKSKDYPPQPERFRLPTTPNSGLPFARGKSLAYVVNFRAAGRFFSVRVSVSRPLARERLKAVEDLLSTIRVQPRT